MEINWSATLNALIYYFRHGTLGNISARINTHRGPLWNTWTIVDDTRSGDGPIGSSQFRYSGSGWKPEAALFCNHRVRRKDNSYLDVGSIHPLADNIIASTIMTNPCRRLRWVSSVSICPSMCISLIHWSRIQDDNVARVTSATPSQVIAVTGTNVVFNSHCCELRCLH